MRIGLFRNRSFLFFIPKNLLIALMPVMFLSAGRKTTAGPRSDAIGKNLTRVVKIYGAGGIRKLHAYSTGLIVRSDGYIVTVWSHVLDTEEVTVVLNDGRRFQAKIHGAEPQLDIAVLKIVKKVQDLPFFDLSKAVNVSVGTRVLGLSNMFKVATGDEPASILHGVVAAKTKLSARRGVFDFPYDGLVYIVDAITNNPGAGGGALITRSGDLVGMIGKELKNRESNTWVNYAYPISELRETIDSIISGKFVSKEKKPDEDENPTRYIASDFGMVLLPDVLYRTPAYIDHVVSGSEASKAKLKEDDLVLFVNDELIQSVKELQKQLGKLEAGDTLRLVVRRGMKLVTLELKVRKKSANTIKKQ